MARTTDLPLTGAVLVTGASSGIGAAFARRFGAEGRPLVLVARGEERLTTVAAELRWVYNVDVEVLVADLATESGRDMVADRLGSDAHPIDTLVNNAGFSLHKSFAETSIEEELTLLQVNVTSVLTLSHIAARTMRQRGRGEIINISSVAGFGVRASSVTYAASKAWVTSFTQSLALALADTGVRVIAVCPGFTRTHFHDQLPKDRGAIAPGWLWLDADDVVAESLHDLRAGTMLSIPSRRYRVLVGASKFVPRPALIRIMSGR